MTLSNDEKEEDGWMKSIQLLRRELGIFWKT